MEKTKIHSSEPYLNLHMPVGTELMIEIVDLKIRVKSTVVGIDYNKFILVNASSLNVVAGGYMDGTIITSPIIIRYLCDGYVYGFKTEVLNIVYKPEKLIFFAYPKEIEEYNIRSNPRYECSLPAEAKIGDFAIDLVIINISKNGCGCVVKTSGGINKEQLFELLKTDMKIDLTMQLPGIENKLGVKSAIRHINAGDDPITIGLIFEDMVSDVKMNLDKFISLVSIV
ncbi:MAG: flagellar brake protein [Nitrospirae bacterium]|nr:flagellar brake protein [Nitrospirota bacterium]